jgi:predicted DNA-binding transcriptional regulator AlpA
MSRALVSTKEAAVRIGLAASTLEKMRVRGDGPPYVRLTPRRVAYAVDTLDTWVRSREFTSTSQYAAA